MQTTTTELLDQAERFIAGFEDDATQEGIEQLLAQIRAAALRRKDMLRKLDSLELRGFGPGRRAEFYGVNGSTIVLEITDSLGNEDAFRQRLACPEGASAHYWNPAHWSLSRTRIDNNGERWSNYSMHDYVVDNFGDLVEVAK